MKIPATSYEAPLPWAKKDFEFQLVALSLSKAEEGGLKERKKKQSKITPSGKVTALIKYLSCSSLRLH